MSGPSNHTEDHTKAEEDDGSAELQPEDGGTAEPGKTHADSRLVPPRHPHA